MCLALPMILLKQRYTFKYRTVASSKLLPFYKSLIDYKLRDEFLLYGRIASATTFGGYSNYRQPVTLLGLNDSVSELFGGQRRTPHLPNSLELQTAREGVGS